MDKKIIEAWQTIHERLTTFVNSKVNDPELTKDIVQDVFLKVFSKNDTLREKDKLVPWIYQITRNEIVSHFRKYEFYENEVAISDEAEPTLNNELTDCVRPFIDTLPGKYREALILSDLEKVPQKELAERLNISYSGLKSRVQRARQMLEATYNECCTISKDIYGNVMDYSPKGKGYQCNTSCD